MNFKRSLLASAVLMATIGITGCNDDDSNDNNAGTTPPTLAADTTYTQYVDPFIGTGFNGHTFPGAVVPEGMVQLSPDTELLGWHSSSGYHYDKETLYGFSHTHLSGTGMGGLGDILFMPYIESEQHEVVTMDKTKETAEPGYYSVEIKDNGIKAELTASERVGFHRYTYPEGKRQKLKIDLNSILNADWGSTPMRNKLTIVDDYTIKGERDSRHFSGWAKNQKVYFYATFDKKIKSAELFANGELMDGPSVEHISEVITTETGGLKRIKADVTAFIEFEGDSSELNAKVAISNVSTDGAERNYQAEADTTFDAVKVAANNKWHDALNDIQIKGGTQEEKEVFYTALYHTKIAPQIFQDVDGQYRGMANGSEVTIQQAAEGETNFGIYSLWDTFRALHPLKTITEPERAVDYAKNLIRKYQEGGLLPKWEHLGDYTGTMVGYPAVTVIADAMTKFPDEFNMAERKLALEAAIASSTWNQGDYQHWDQAVLNRVMTPHIKYIEEIGFAPAVVKDTDGNIISGTAESVSYGLENAFYDWSIAQIARLAGDDATQIKYIKRSQNYKRYFDKNPAEYSEYGVTGFMRPVMESGEWSTPFDPYNAIHETGNYTEGNAWQWTWFAPHDIPGLKYEMGGEAAFMTNLDATFTANQTGEETPDMSGLIGQVAFGNEPSHHIPYLYNWTSEPWKTQEVVDYILDEMYTNQPAGVVGNEDVGSMSAWYVMSAMGFYQVNGADPVYTVGRPLFDEVVIPVAGGEFTVTAENNTDDNMYIKEVTINGKALGEHFTFNHSEFKPGGELNFVMTGDQSEAMKPVSVN